MAKFLKLLKNKPLGLIGTMIIFCVIVIAIIGPYITLYDSDAMNFKKRFLPPVWMQGGSMEHVLGTDMLGRDIFSRLVYGTRTSVITGISSSLIALIIGVSLGCWAGIWEVSPTE